MEATGIYSAEPIEQVRRGDAGGELAFPQDVKDVRDQSSDDHRSVDTSGSQSTYSLTTS